jgi:hypothetical protein
MQHAAQVLPIAIAIAIAIANRQSAHGPAAQPGPQPAARHPTPGHPDIRTSGHPHRAPALGFGN